MPRFLRRSHLSAPRQDVFDWHARPGALDRLCPPRQGGEVVQLRLEGALRRQLGRLEVTS